MNINDIVADIKPVLENKVAFIEYCTTDDTRISTGWPSMDKALNGGLVDELYILGAETSTGKSALMLNLAENIAKQGINVLYFTLEMSVKELIVRGVSQMSFIAHGSDTSCKKYTTADILYWSYDESIHDFVKIPYVSYADYIDDFFNTYGDHLYIVDPSLDGYTVKNIADIAQKFQDQHRREKLVIFVDYLQIINSDKDDRSQTDRKTKMDVVVKTLKILSSQLGIPVFAASSIGRSSYNERVTTSSFKESGDTEYTGGILIGWNWVDILNASDDDLKTIKERCNNLGYRKMEFDILKYRNSNRDHTVRLVYFPAHNHIIDEEDWNPDFSHENPFENWADKKPDDGKLKNNPDSTSTQTSNPISKRKFR